MGVAVGLITSLALTRLMKALLFGVSATDPTTFSLIAIMLTAIALVACYFQRGRRRKWTR